MNHDDMAPMPEDLAPDFIDAEDLGPCDSFDEPVPQFVGLLERSPGFEFVDHDEPFLDEPPDEEERDDELILGLLADLGVNLDDSDPGLVTRRNQFESDIDLGRMGDPVDEDDVAA